MVVHSLQTIESQDLTLGKLFNDFYVVPSFQREYVWEDKQVEQLLLDIYTEFSNDKRDSTSEYFIGSIVVFAHPDGVYELIDGQQRMTTTFLTLCAIRDHLKAIGASEEIAPLTKQIADTDVDEEGHNIFRYRVSLQYEDSRGVLGEIAEGSANVDLIPEATRSVRNILNSYRMIRSFLNSELPNEHEVRRFYAYFTRNVKLIRVKTISIAHALKVFETINDRGVGLDSMDLLKNLMFMQAKQHEFDGLKTTWKLLVDILFETGEKPLRFLRYFIFSQYDVDRLKEDEIYEWFVKNKVQCGYESDPTKFVNQLLNAARAYSNFIQGKDVTGEQNRYLINIRYMSGAARQHLILLLAGQRLPTVCFNDLCRHLENLLFAYLITREPTKELEHRFAQWAGELRRVDAQDDLLHFILKRFQPAKESLVARFEFSFRELNESSIQQYRMRYLLGKLTQYVNEQAYGSSSGEGNLGNFINNNVDIEHILPKSPSQAVIASFDQPEQIQEHIRRLGNLAFLEKSINSSIGNGLFAEKKKPYRESKFLLTKSLGERVSIGVDTAIDRAVRELETFETWDSAAIDRRQMMLARIARKVWEMPGVASEMNGLAVAD